MSYQYFKMFNRFVDTSGVTKTFQLFKSNEYGLFSDQNNNDTTMLVTVSLNFVTVFVISSEPLVGLTCAFVQSISCWTNYWKTVSMVSMPQIMPSIWSIQYDPKNLVIEQSTTIDAFTPWIPIQLQNRCLICVYRWIQILMNILNVL